MIETTFYPVDIKISIKSKLAPRWDKDFSFMVNPVTQNIAERKEINNWLIENGGENVIIKDINELNIDTTIPPDLEYYHNDKLLGYVNGIYKGIILFSPTAEIRKLTE